jgi:hypothetical protein
MKASKNSCLTLTLAMLIILLAACSGPDDAPTEPDVAAPVDATGAQNAPPGRLDQSVVPTKYDIELAVDPSQERFSGNVSIDVQLNAPTKTVWLHGKDLDVSGVLPDGQ